MHRQPTPTGGAAAMGRETHIVKTPRQMRLPISSHRRNQQILRHLQPALEKLHAPGQNAPPIPEASVTHIVKTTLQMRHKTSTPSRNQKLLSHLQTIAQKSHTPAEHASHKPGPRRRAPSHNPNPQPPIPNPRTPAPC